MKPFLLFTTCLFFFTNSNGQEWIPFEAGGLWGYKDSSGVIQISPQYEFTNKFQGPYAIVENQDRLGAINKNNELIIPFEYDYLQYFAKNLFTFGYRAKYFGEYNIGLRDLQNRVWLPPLYYHIEQFNNLFIVTQQTVELIPTDEGGKRQKRTTCMGLVDRNNKVIIPVAHSNFLTLNDSLITAGENFNMHLYDISGQQLTQKAYFIISSFSNGLATALNEHGAGFVNTKGKEIVPCQYENTFACYDGIGIFKNKGLFGLIDTSGKEIMPPTYADINHLGNQQFTAFNGKKWGIVHQNGKELVPCVYDSIRYHFLGVAALKKDGSWYVYDSRQQKLLDEIYDAAFLSGYSESGKASPIKNTPERARNSFLLAKKKTQWYLLNREYQVLAGPENDIKDVKTVLNIHLSEYKKFLHKIYIEANEKRFKD